MRILTSLFLINLFFFSIHSAAFYKELSGWIKTEISWVVEEPNTKSKIIGIIKQKAYVTVDDLGNGWAKIIFAPVRDPMTMEWNNCTDCYIQTETITTLIPGKW